MKTIALETSSQPGEIALLDRDDIVFEESLPADRRTTQSFAVHLRSALGTVGWRARDVNLFAVCSGPGSFTGLRIGITAAKTYAYATGCQVAAVDTLAVVARQWTDCQLPIWAVLDAQRRQLFVAQFQYQEGQLQRLAATHIVDAEQWLPTLGPGLAITGTGLRKWRSIIPDRVRLAEEGDWAVKAGRLGREAVAEVRAGRSADLWHLAPNYHRPSAAEEKLGPSG